MALNHDKIVVLDVGGTKFRSKSSTLTAASESFFQKMIELNFAEKKTLNDPQNESSIFIDRDPTCFPSILSFLRSGKIYFTEDVTNVYLAMLLDEASFYMLDGLVEEIEMEISRREKRMRDDEERENADTATDAIDVFKSVSASDVDDYFKRGYAYVGSYELPEHASCNANTSGTPYETTFTGTNCSACGASMGYEKWVKHVGTIKPVRIVVKRNRSQEDKYKLMQSPFRLRGMTALTSSNAEIGVRHPNSSLANAVPVSPVPNRSGSSMAPLTPGQFTLDQSF